MINEKKLSDIIKKDYTRIVNLFDDYFQYCNGFIVANCSYDNHVIIQTLFKVGAIENYRNLKSNQSRSLESIINCGDEVDAVKTDFIKEYERGKYAHVFKVEDKYYIFNKIYLDIFKGPDYKYKAIYQNEAGLPLLKIFDNDNFIGMILPLRELRNSTDEFMQEIAV